MAVKSTAKLSVAQLTAALRLGDTTEEQAQATRLLGYSRTAVDRFAPDAPMEAKNEACIRLSGYLYDQPFAGRGAAYGNALRNSGAQAILLPYRVIRAGLVG